MNKIFTPIIILILTVGFSNNLMAANQNNAQTAASTKRNSQQGDARLWQLYSRGYFEELKQIIADKKEIYEGWRPPSELTRLIHLNRHLS